MNTGITVEFEHPVKEALSKVGPKAGPPKENVAEEVDKLRRQMNALFPLEAYASKAIEKRIAHLSDQNLVKGDCPPISLEILKWRSKKDGWPVFAMFDMSSPICRFGGFWSQRAGRLPMYAQMGAFNGVLRGKEGNILCGTPSTFKLPYGESVMDYYGDVFEKLARLDTDQSRPKAGEIYATFNGVIPDSTRQKIVDASDSKRFNQIVIIAEASWSLALRPFNPDPLVVGFSDSGAWLIDSFDLTPIENIVKSEFTS